MIAQITLSPFQVTAEDVPLEPCHPHHLIVIIGLPSARPCEGADVVAEISGGSWEESAIEQDAYLTINGKDTVDNGTFDERLLARGIHPLTVIIDLPLPKPDRGP